MTTQSKATETEINSIAERIVRNDVLLCVSALVSEATQQDSGAAVLGLDEDELFSLCTSGSTYYRCDECGEEFATEEDAEEHAEGKSCLDNPTYSDDSDEDEVRFTCDECGEEFATEAEAIAHVASRICIDEPEYTEDAEEHEVFEHWVISRYLADELRGQGETVIDTNIGHVWGRTTTGQAIDMDGVIQAIACGIYNRTR